MTDQTNRQPRIFKTGSTIIAEDASTAGLTPEQVRDLLRYSFPEVANAAINTRTGEDGTQIVEFLPRPGRKG